MRTKFFALSLMAIFFSSSPAVSPAYLNAHNRLVQPQIEAKELDGRAEVLNSYLAQFNSPLQNHAQDFVDAADEYGVDWKLVPAIAGVESTFGKFIPGGYAPSSTSYNGWGWGVYGDNAIYFHSWREGIFTVTAGLRKNYLDKGLKDPYAMNVVYAASPVWGRNVNFFLKDLKKFELQSAVGEKEALQKDLSMKIAGASGSQVKTF